MFRTLAACVLACAALPAVMAVEIEGVVNAVDTGARKLSITRKTATGDKALSLDVSPEAGDLSSLNAGDRIKLDYDPEQECVTRIVDVGLIALDAGVIVGAYDVHWAGTTGNNGTIRYGLREDHRFVRAGIDAGEWTITGKTVELRFTDTARGSAVIRFLSPELFRGTHTNGEGMKSKWEGARVR